MKNDLKKKFLDILFEPEEPDEVVAEGPIKEVKEHVPTKTAEPVKTVRTQRASDVLYGNDNNETNKAFINYQEISKTTTINTAPKYVKEEEKLVDLSDTYELKRHISPIFGETEEKVSKKEETVKKPVQPMPSMPKGDYQGVVLSPIFGYDNASADKARTNFVKNKTKDSAILREPTKIQSNKNVKVEQLYDEPISLFEEPFDVDDKKVKEDEPFTSEIKVIDVEGEPIEEVKQEDDEEVKPYEVNDLDELDMYSNSKDEGMSSNAKSFIDDLLGDKE